MTTIEIDPNIYAGNLKIRNSKVEDTVHAMWEDRTLNLKYKSMCTHFSSDTLSTNVATEENVNVLVQGITCQRCRELVVSHATLTALLRKRDNRAVHEILDGLREADLYLVKQKHKDTIICTCREALELCVSNLIKHPGTDCEIVSYNRESTHSLSTEIVVSLETVSIKGLE